MTELTATTKRGARGLLLPPTMEVGNPSENELLPDTAAQLELVDGASKLKVAAVDSGFTLNATRQALAGIGAEVFIVGSKKNSGSRRHQRRLARYRVGLREGSPTSSAGTASAAHGSMARPGFGPGWPGPSWPTTCTLQPASRLGSERRRPPGPT